MKARIERLVWQGKGLARDENGRIILIEPEVLPDELVQIEIIKNSKKLLLAKPIYIIETSKWRQEHPCKHFAQGCGGCRFGFVKTDYALRLKKEILLDVLRRNFGQEQAALLTPEIFSSQQSWNYRLRTQIHIQSGLPHFMATKSHNLIPISSCKLLIPELGDNLKELTALLPNGRHTLAASPISHKIANNSNELLDFSLPQFSLFWQQNAGCFFQANWKLNEKLVQTVANELTGFKKIIDLYCGSGNFSLPLARQDSYILGLESDKTSIYCAKLAAEQNGLTTRCQFQQTNLNKYFVKDFVSEFQPTAAVLDPPRTGAVNINRQLVQFKQLQKIVWISCDAVNTCRDIKPLLTQDWKLQKVFLFDMFVQTWHIEVIFVLEKN